MLNILKKLTPAARLILSFAAGGLVVFLILYFTVVMGLNRDYNETKEKLADEPGKLLDRAEKHFENGDYDRANETLEKLSEKYPNSGEAVEGEELSVEIERTIEEENGRRKALDREWEKAEEVVKDGWKKAQAAFLRKEMERRMAQLESNLDEILEGEWERIKRRARKEWEEMVMKEQP